MKIYKKIKREIIQNSLDYMKCDICGKIVKENDTWDKEDFETIETEISMKKGYQYPEGGSGIEVNIDICPECFENKIIPFIESFGNKIEIKEWDY